MSIVIMNQCTCILPYRVLPIDGLTFALCRVELLDKLNTQYEAVHKAYEDNFWATKMALKASFLVCLTP